MKKYQVEILETSSRIIDIEATSKDEAIDKVEEMHRKEEIVLTAGDFSGVEFNLLTEICPHCEIPLESKMIDVDGTNLEEHRVCPDCGYGTPALR